MKTITKFIKQYYLYIIGFMLVIIIILLGFTYGNYVTISNEEVKEEPEKIEEKTEKKEETKIFVDIKGEVKNPGVYECDLGQRLIDVIKKAGGLTKSANTDTINLSKKVSDEMVIIIYSNDEIKDFTKKKENQSEIKEVIKYETVEVEKTCPNTTNQACIYNDNSNETKEENVNTKEDNSIEKNALVNLNTASKEELMTLPGIGESKAELIIAYRNISKYENVEDIKNVKGIGDALFEKIKDYITI